MKAILMITALLVSVSAFAENQRMTFNYEYQQAKEAQRCAKSVDYCKLQQELKNLYTEQYKDSVQLRNVKYITYKACENSDIRKLERASFDPIANRFPVKTSCDAIPEYQESVKKYQTLVSYLEQKLQSLNDRIVEIKMESNTLAAQID